MSDIRNELSRAAGPPEPPIDLGALHRRARSRRQRRRVALAGLGAVVLLGIGSLAWASGSGDQQVTVGQDPGVVSETTTLPDETTTTTEATPSTEATTTTTATTAPSTTAPGTTAPPSSIAPPTTSTVPSTLPPAETTLPPVAGDRHLSGTHRGVGLPYEPSAGDCVELAHKLDGVFSLDTGEDWNYHADYCGTVDSDSLWQGAGTFTFTTPTGDTLTGTFTSRAVLPTKGEPYSLTVTDGTGAWAGANGTCDLTNHITVFPSGMQEQAGLFTCDIRTPAASIG